jgi:ABC-type Mn2+/Zn2+ transport system permease subunit
MHNLANVLVPIVFFALVFGMFYLYIVSRNKERMALIEKGADAKIFFGERQASTGKWILTLGIFIIGIALGILCGNLLDSAGMREEIAYPGAIFLFAGIGLVAAYFIGRRVNGEK